MATPTTLPATFVAGNVLTAAQMNNLRGAFRVLQVVSTVKSDTFSTASSTFSDVTGLSVTITPSATSSKILIFADVKMHTTIDGHYPGVRLLRDSTAIYVGDTAGSRTPALFGTSGGGSGMFMTQAGGTFLDSPNTTSATVYKIQMRTVGGTYYINRGSTDTDNSSFYRMASSITALEISA